MNYHRAHNEFWNNISAATKTFSSLHWRLGWSKSQIFNCKHKQKDLVIVCMISMWMLHLLSRFVSVMTGLKSYQFNWTTDFFCSWIAVVNVFHDKRSFQHHILRMQQLMHENKLRIVSLRSHGKGQSFLKLIVRLLAEDDFNVSWWSIILKVLQWEKIAWKWCQTRTSFWRCHYRAHECHWYRDGKERWNEFTRTSTKDIQRVQDPVFLGKKSNVFGKNLAGYRLVPSTAT